MVPSHPVHLRGSIQVAGSVECAAFEQGSPVICQAGGSPRGRRFAAQWAETIITQAQGEEAMKAIVADVEPEP